MIRIYADFNNADVLGRVRMNTFGLMRDVESKGLILTEGLKVILDDEDELRAVGIIEFSETEQIWVAKIDWDKIENY